MCIRDSRTLTNAEKGLIASSNTMTTADWKALASSGALTKEYALRLSLIHILQNIRRAGVMAPPQELLTVQVEHNTMQPADTLRCV